MPLQKRIVFGSNEWQLLRHLDFQRIDFVMAIERVRVICDAEVGNLYRRKLGQERRPGTEAERRASQVSQVSQSGCGWEVEVEDSVTVLWTLWTLWLVSNGGRIDRLRRGREDN